MHQADALLGPKWLGHSACKDPTILCGDFNAVPSSRLPSAREPAFKRAVESRRAPAEANVFCPLSARPHRPRLRQPRLGSGRRGSAEKRPDSASVGSLASDYRAAAAAGVELIQRLAEAAYDSVGTAFSTVLGPSSVPLGLPQAAENLERREAGSQPLAKVSCVRRSKRRRSETYAICRLLFRHLIQQFAYQDLRRTAQLMPAAPAIERASWLPVHLPRPQPAAP